jgi:diguanylate cyclase (GGDEF)-like protein
MAEAATPTRCVLVAGFDLRAYEELRRKLESLGYRVRSLALAEDADGTDDALIAAGWMPDLAKLLSLPALADRPRLCLLRRLDETAVESALRSGATDLGPRQAPAPLLDHLLRQALERTGARRELHLLRHDLREIQAAAKIASFEFDPATGKIDWTEPAAVLFGSEPAAGTDCLESLVKQVLRHDQHALRIWFENVSLGRRVPPQEFSIGAGDGAEQRLRIRVDGRKRHAGHGIAGLLQDVTLRTRAALALDRTTHHDSLTGLVNRQQFYHQVQHALSVARMYQRKVAVLLFDLHRFKQINESLGHEAGDVLLQDVAERLDHAMHTVVTDTTVSLDSHGPCLARVGGDEFALLLPDLADAADAAVTGQQLLDLLEEPFEVRGKEIFVTTSIGISVFPDHEESADALLKTAEMAMYHSKDAGRSQLQYYKPASMSADCSRLDMETHLRRALERHEFKLLYHPRIDLRSGRVIGFEALIRWDHPERGLIPPDLFVPLAEETGLIVPMGAWVLREACEQNRRWQDAGHPPVRVSVNLSSVQFRQPGLLGMIQDALRHSQQDPELLELELTESTLMRDLGTGYSSLSYLKRFPIQTLKIDRSFVRDILRNPDDAALTEAIIRMAHSLRLRVTAEGVESVEQLDYLRSKGCDEAQGHYFSEPVSGDEAARYLAASIHEPICFEFDPTVDSR